jgi:hypothetical protein
MMCGAADLHLRAIRFIDTRQRIVMMPTAAAATTVMALVIPVASPHALILSVSHGSPVANSCLTVSTAGSYSVQAFVLSTKPPSTLRASAPGANPQLRRNVVTWPAPMRRPQHPFGRDSVAAALAFTVGVRCR